MNKTRTLTALGLALATSATALTAVVYRRFQHDLHYSYARIGSLKSQTQELSSGPVEYLTHGQGSPVLLAHVLFGGVDQGLVEARSLFGGFRSILVSRFGYLGSPLPEQASPALQADAYAWLLDALGISQVTMVGMSGGGPSAVQFALRHADRCSALILLSSHGPQSSSLPPKWAFSLLAKTDVVMWVMSTYFRSALYAIMGISKEVLPTLRAQEQQHLHETLETFLPVKPRSAGVLFDTYVSNPDMDQYPFEQITVPTLVLHAKDDPLSSFSSVRVMAARIPGARLVTFERGGHLLVGNQEQVAFEITHFLQQQSVLES